mmetsp:Transcript_24855/g.71552  ORF Transcript_24855/g.71552 Transcript_24855/m.71552 type:complete len:467 (-) Transcript_24855:36-1436(-)
MAHKRGGDFRRGGQHDSGEQRQCCFFCAAKLHRRVLARDPREGLGQDPHELRGRGGWLLVQPRVGHHAGGGACRVPPARHQGLAAGLPPQHAAGPLGAPAGRHGQEAADGVLHNQPPGKRREVRPGQESCVLRFPGMARPHARQGGGGLQSLEQGRLQGAHPQPGQGGRPLHHGDGRVLRCLPRDLFRRCGAWLCPHLRAHSAWAGEPLEPPQFPCEWEPGHFLRLRELARAQAGEAMRHAEPGRDIAGCQGQRERQGHLPCLPRRQGRGTHPQPDGRGHSWGRKLPHHDQRGVQRRQLHRRAVSHRVCPGEGAHHGGRRCRRGRPLLVQALGRSLRGALGRRRALDATSGRAVDPRVKDLEDDRRERRGPGPRHARACALGQQPQQQVRGADAARRPHRRVCQRRKPLHRALRAHPSQAHSGLRPLVDVLPRQHVHLRLQLLLSQGAAVRRQGRGLQAHLRAAGN